MAKYYYNGVLLPEIPADVLAQYPYAWIQVNLESRTYNLVVSKSLWYYKGSSNGQDSANCPTTPNHYYSIGMDSYEDANEWPYNTSFSGAFKLGYNNTRYVLWSNHDIPNGSATSTTIYFYGSEPVPVYDRKYLIRSNSTLYTVTDGALVPLSDTEVSASLFRDYGVDELPDGSLLAGLTDPEVLYWHDSTDDLPTLSLTVTGTPPVPQVVVTDAQDMSDSIILGIESVTVTASDDVLWAISFDDGATWKAHNGSHWVTLEQENSGMTAETFQNLSLEAWAEVVTSTAYRLRFVLMTTDSYVSEVIINYINP